MQRAARQGCLAGGVIVLGSGGGRECRIILTTPELVSPVHPSFRRTKPGLHTESRANYFARVQLQE